MEVDGNFQASGIKNQKRVEDRGCYDRSTATVLQQHLITAEIFAHRRDSSTIAAEETSKKGRKSPRDKSTRRAYRSWEGGEKSLLHMNMTPAAY